MDSSGTASGLWMYAFPERSCQDIHFDSSFIDNLPVESKKVITKYIKIGNDDKLFDLAHHLRTAVLIPSMYFYSI
jgi:hypothetical protein